MDLGLGGLGLGFGVEGLGGTCTGLAFAAVGAYTSSS